MTRAAALCASLLCACSFPGPPTLLPPPFGPDPDRPEPARFFFPTGIAIDASWVVVTNSNADLLYDAGAMYSLRAADLAQYFPPNPPRSTDSFPDSALAGKEIIGNYSGPLVLAGDLLAGERAVRQGDHRQLQRTPRPRRRDEGSAEVADD